MPDRARPRTLSTRGELRELARSFLAALLSDFDAGIRERVREAFQRSGSLLYVMSRLVDTARIEVQDMWYRGELSVLDELRMMRHLELVVLELSRDLPRPPPPIRRCVLTATEPLHGDLTQRLLEEDGWMVIRLEIGDAVREMQGIPGVARRLVVITGDAVVAGPEVRPLVAATQRLGSRVLLAVPGHWAQVGRWHRLGAEAVVGDARTLLLVARKLRSAGSDFAISEVARSMGVTAHTIRAWERRYELPQPARDHSGQRRYSAEDVELLLRISHGATVHGRSLRLASLEAQGIVSDEPVWVEGALDGPWSTPASGADQDWRRIADAVPKLLLLVDQRGIIVDCNIAMARFRDTVRESLRGEQFTDMVIDYDRAKAARLFRPSLNERDSWELRLQSTNDVQTVVAFDSRIVATDSGHLLGLIGSIVPLETGEIPWVQPTYGRTGPPDA